jgi:hypothetical protein
MLNSVFQFYLDGFRSMRLGRTLWKIVLIKLLVMFAVIKILFFPNVLKTRFDNDHDRAEHVLNNLTVIQDTKTANKQPYQSPATAADQ